MILFQMFERKVEGGPLHYVRELPLGISEPGACNIAIDHSKNNAGVEVEIHTKGSRFFGLKSLGLHDWRFTD